MNDPTMDEGKLSQLDPVSLRATAVTIAQFTVTLKAYYAAMTRVGNDQYEAGHENDQYKSGDTLWNKAMDEVLSTKSILDMRMQGVDSLRMTAIEIRNRRIRMKLKQDQEEEDAALASILTNDAKLPETSDTVQLDFESSLDDTTNTEDQETTVAAAAETEDEMDPYDPLLLTVDAEFSEPEQEADYDDDDDGDFVVTTVAAAETEDEMDSTVPANAEFGSDGDGDELSEQEVDPFVAETEDEADGDDDNSV